MLMAPCAEIPMLLVLVSSAKKSPRVSEVKSLCTREFAVNFLMDDCKLHCGGQEVKSAGPNEAGRGVLVDPAVRANEMAAGKN